MNGLTKISTQIPDLIIKKFVKFANMETKNALNIVRWSLNP